MKFKEIIGAGIVATALMTGMAITPANASTGVYHSVVSTQGDQSYLRQVDDSTFVLKIADGMKLAEDGTAITNSTGEKVNLPTSTKDKNGNSVTLRYSTAADDDNLVVINVLAAQGSSLRSAQGNPVQCTLGTVGGLGSGVLLGGGAGAAVGGLGALPGAIIGGVSGAATGAAASCFN